MTTPRTTWEEHAKLKLSSEVDGFIRKKVTSYLEKETGKPIETMSDILDRIISSLKLNVNDMLKTNREKVGIGHLRAIPDEKWIQWIQETRSKQPLTQLTKAEKFKIRKSVREKTLEIH